MTKPNLAMQQLGDFQASLNAWLDAPHQEANQHDNETPISTGDANGQAAGVVAVGESNGELGTQSDINGLLERNYAQRLSAYNGDPRSIHEGLSFAGPAGVVKKLTNNELENNYWLFKTNVGSLDAIQQQLTEAGGLSKDIAMEALSLFPKFDGGRNVGFYTSHVSKQRYKPAFESVEVTYRQTVQDLIEASKARLADIFMDSINYHDQAIDSDQAQAFVAEQVERASKACIEDHEHFQALEDVTDTLVTFFHEQGLDAATPDQQVKHFDDLEGLAACLIPNQSFTFKDLNGLHFDVVEHGQWSQAVLKLTDCVSELLNQARSQLDPLTALEDRLKVSDTFDPKLVETVQALQPLYLQWSSLKLKAEDVVAEVYQQGLRLEAEPPQAACSIEAYVHALARVTETPYRQAVIEARAKCASFVAEVYQRVYSDVPALVEAGGLDVASPLARALVVIDERVTAWVKIAHRLIHQFNAWLACVSSFSLQGVVNLRLVFQALAEAIQRAEVSVPGQLEAVQRALEAFQIDGQPMDYNATRLSTIAGEFTPTITDDDGD